MATLKAEIQPNSKKYYGTEIKLTTDDGREAYFLVWINRISDDTPSTREIDFVGDDGKFYFRDEDGDVYEYEICDDHYETAAALKVCEKIVEALNGLEI